MEKYVVNPHKKYHRSLAAIRMSSHRLHTETGRYNGTPRNKRICRGCVTGDAEIVEGFLSLPECVLQVEDEMHTLFDCDYYTDVRSTKGLDELRLAAVNYAPQVFTDTGLIRRMGELASAVLGKHRKLLVLTKPTN